MKKGIPALSGDPFPIGNLTPVPQPFRRGNGGDAAAGPWALRASTDSEAGLRGTPPPVKGVPVMSSEESRVMSSAMIEPSNVAVLVIADIAVRREDGAIEYGVTLINLVEYRSRSANQVKEEVARRNAGVENSHALCPGERASDVEDKYVRWLRRAGVNVLLLKLRSPLISMMFVPAVAREDQITCLVAREGERRRQGIESR